MAYQSNSKQLQRLFKKFKKYNQDGRFTDVTISVPDTYGSEKMIEYKSHKIILASFSTYFRSELTTILNNGAKVESCRIKGISNEGFGPIFEFLYSNTLPYDGKKLAALLQVTDYLDIDMARINYTSFIRRYSMPLSQAIAFFEIASSTSTNCLMEKFSDQILQNFSTCLQLYRRELLDMQLRNILPLIERDENDASEADLLIFALEYLDQRSLESSEREKLFKAVRLNSIPANQFQSIIKDHKLSNELNKLYQESHHQPRDGNYNYIAYIDKNSRDCIYIYDSSSNVLHHLSEASDRPISHLKEICMGINEATRHFHSLELRNGNLACVVGYDKTQNRLPCFFRYENKIWHQQYRLQIELDAYVQVGFRILNFGGYDPNRSTDLKGCAIYGDGPWKLIPSLTEKRSEHALIFNEGAAYALGGQNDIHVLNTCESIQVDPLANCWDSIAPMNHARQGHKAAFLMGKIYVVGGYETRRSENPSNKLVLSNEFYDILTNTWTDFAPASSHLHCLALNACNGRLYALLSPDSGFTRCNMEIHVYNPQAYTWQMLLRTTLDRPVFIKYSCIFSKSDIAKI
ncbi:hypothetical protein Ciccas_009176 [Cichlidogyrus casuarinus]|uniref:BTB domain-containing protein n=1 Tax=Cichlidogyrus casuarinus TaxID=1844966 RepID=A0ABD2PYH8_9PLAT